MHFGHTAYALWTQQLFPVCPLLLFLLRGFSLVCASKLKLSTNDEIGFVVCEGCLHCSIRMSIVQGIAKNCGRCIHVHFQFGYCYNLEFHFVMCLVFGGGENLIFMTTAGICVLYFKPFAQKECRELTPKQNNIDFANDVAMTTRKKRTKLLVLCRHYDWDLPQRVPTTREGRNSEVSDTQLSSERSSELFSLANGPCQKKIATPSDLSFSTAHKAIAPKALVFAIASSKSISAEQEAQHQSLPCPGP